MAKSASGKFVYPTGRDGARALGYDLVLVDAALSGLLEPFCGIGNPFSLFPIRPGSIILDVGCGGGFDMYIASRMTGPEGTVRGIDLTQSMVRRARENLQQAGIANAELQQAGAENLPFKENTFDVVISNDVINLSPEKQTVFREINRVLKPGGKFGFADVVLEHELPRGLAGSVEAWSQSISGAIPIGDHLLALRSAGFSDILFTGMSGFRTSPYTPGALFRAAKKAA